jgi:glycosyltransferase involved in cell wall biosynthesis
MIDVSVVMGVFNGEGELAATLDSVLAQEGCNFEFIVVDDGSTDGTGRMLDEAAARDLRLHVIHQANTGLTRALAHGCARARGEFIARQDCGDISLPGRLARQWACLRHNSDVVMVACAVRYLAPGRESLYVAQRVGTELQEGLSVLNVRRIQGPPHHGATMFRRGAYEKAGGYRARFVVAQDIDLWLRLCELGRCMGEAEVGYEAHLAAGSISARRRKEQLELADLAIACAGRRRAGLDDSSLLVSAGPDLPRPGGTRVRFERARFFYFIGSCLRRSDPAAARGYYWQALRENPLLVQALIRLALVAAGSIVAGVPAKPTGRRN